MSAIQDFFILITEKVGIFECSETSDCI